MNLYLISQSVNNDYDTYDSAVVVAESEEAARMIHPSGHNSTWPEGDHYTSGRHTWAADPKDVNVMLIGTADHNLETDSGVVCASFNAG